MKKIILDLCGGTGSWSKPYAEAGYDVRVISYPMYDVNKFIPPESVYGILAAPPCTQFSFARTRAKKERDLTTGFETVQSCLRIIWQCRLSGSLNFWALENPKGYLRQLLGKPPLEFNPFDFGDPYSKATDLWGYFNHPKKNPVPVAEDCIKFGVKQNHLKHVSFRDLFNEDGYERCPTMNIRQIRRSVTPAGFAQAFFKANR